MSWRTLNWRRIGIVIVVCAVLGLAIGLWLRPAVGQVGQRPDPNQPAPAAAADLPLYIVAGVIGLPCLYIFMNSQKYPERIVTTAIGFLTTIVTFFFGRAL